MGITVCLCANTLGYPQGGGHRWVYLNWALGLRALGCQVIWLEWINHKWLPNKVMNKVAALKDHLSNYHLAKRVAVCSRPGAILPQELTEDCLDLDVAVEADLLLNLQYGMPSWVVERFRRSALIDIDPGLLQIWISRGWMRIARHDTYFTIGETVGQPGATIPDLDLEWQYTPPCVALNWWPPRWAPEGAPFTAVAHWYGGVMENGGESYDNSKRSAFMRFLELPRRTRQPLELAIDLVPHDQDQLTLWEKGWRVRESVAVASTPWNYQRYIQESRGEFSCVKPSCIRLQNAWISDRTLCYLASGKPALVEHTGPSRFLPEAEGLFRFRDLDEAVRSLEQVTSDYERQCRLARMLAEEYFDAKKVVGRVLERAMT